jgi:hypothetical protein
MAKKEISCVCSMIHVCMAGTSEEPPVLSLGSGPDKAMETLRKSGSKVILWRCSQRHALEESFLGKSIDCSWLKDAGFHNEAEVARWQREDK